MLTKLECRTRVSHLGPPTATATPLGEKRSYLFCLPIYDHSLGPTNGARFRFPILWVAARLQSRHSPTYHRGRHFIEKGLARRTHTIRKGCCITGTIRGGVQGVWWRNGGGNAARSRSNCTLFWTCCVRIQGRNLLRTCYHSHQTKRVFGLLDISGRTEDQDIPWFCLGSLFYRRCARRRRTSAWDLQKSRLLRPSHPKSGN
jgi:hypothetical protein